MAILSGNRTGRSDAAGYQIDSSIDLVGLADTFLRRRWTIIVCVLAAVALAFLALSVITPRFTATSRILIDPRQQLVVQNEIVQQGVGGDMALVDSQIEVIRSASVLERVVKEADLASDTEFVQNADGSRDASDIALESLAKTIEVSRPDNTYVIEISVTTKEAAKSARLATAVATAYVADQVSSSANAARAITSDISGRLAELQQQLNAAEEKVEAFKREHNLSEAEGRLLGDRELTNLSTRQATTIARVNDAKTRLQVMQDAMRSRGYVGAGATDTDSTMSALRLRATDAKQQLADLQQVLGPRHPRVTAVQEQVRAAEGAVRAESERLVAAAQDNYKAAMDALNAVNADLKDATANSFSNNQDLIRLRELEREAQAVKVVYESFLLRAKETAQQEGIAARTARVLAEAAVPNLPSFPPRLPLLAAAVLLGLFVGILAAILRDLIAGRLAPQKSSSPEVLPGLTAGRQASKEPDGLVLVTTLEDAETARRGALELAHGKPRTRKAILLDLAQDAPSITPGFAEFAAGQKTLLQVISVSGTVGVHLLNAGRPIAVANLSRDLVSSALEVLAADYDDIVVNIGELDGDHTVPAEMVAEIARKAVLVVLRGRVSVREKQVVEALSNHKTVSVSMLEVTSERVLDRAI